MDELYFGVANDDYLEHVGRSKEDGAPGRGSGRYPLGSGENPNQHTPHKAWSYEETKKLRAQGMTDKEIADYFGIKQADFRRKQSFAKSEEQANNRALVERLRYDRQMSFRAIEEKTGIPASQARALLQDKVAKKLEKEQQLYDILRNEIAEKGHIDVGAGTEQNLGISDTKLKQMVKNLQDEGYVLSHPKVDQAGTGYETSLLVLSKKDTPKGYIYNHLDEIKTIEDLHVVDDGEKLTPKKMHDPVSLSSDRLAVVYAEDGGVDKDGTIEIRRGVKDLSLGDNNYAQVRIAVDGTHYLKGMAVYADDLPDGVDVRFNTNKHKGTPIMSDDPDAKQVLKTLKDAPGVNAFGATIKRQNDWKDKDGTEHEGLVNIVKESGDWSKQSKTLASQMLSKQSPELAKRQLGIDLDFRKQQYDDICALTNPAVKQKMLQSFADECDAAAVHLKAAAMPRQAWNVILPMTTLKDNEIYAPQFKDGETVVCIRYPHEGRYQIPQLIVNNKNAEGKRIITPGAIDAVGINAKVAERLSGADFDGDTVLVIPNNAQPNGKRLIKVDPPLEGLKNFDAKESYPGYKGMKVMTHAQTQMEMGKISNLVTDMTLQGATPEELARATKHANCIIDAEKHKLDWHRSEKENRIDELKAKYQPKDPVTGKGGAQTLISRAKNPVYVDKRMTNQPYTTDPETGQKIWKRAKGKPVYDVSVDPETGKKIYTKREGEVRYAQEKSYQMAETENAYDLISKSNTKIERVYADYANACKALGNRARKEKLATKNVTYDKEAAKEYAEEVKSLQGKLNTALKNAPRERQAQILANSEVQSLIDDARRQGNEPTKAEIRKWTAKRIEKAREATGAKKTRVVFTDREWEAIQKGAIPHTQVVKLLSNANEDDYKKRATPKENKAMTSAKISKAKSLSKAGYTVAEIADYLGVSPSTVGKELNK